MREFLLWAEAWLRSLLGDTWAGYTEAIVAAGVVVVVSALATRGGMALAWRFAKGTRNDIDDELVSRLQIPSLVLPFVLAAHAASAILVYPLWTGACLVIEGLLFAYVAISAFEMLVIEQYLARSQGLQIPPLVRQFLIWVSYLAVLVTVISQVFNVDVTPLLATGSVTTLVVGLALQQPLSNLFSGLVLHLERSPTVGDWVLVDNREGQILTIGWRSTRLRLFSDDVLIVPNAAIVNAVMVNFSQPARACARLVNFPVPLDVPPRVFEGWVAEVAAGIEGILAEPRPKAWLISVDEWCQRYTVKLWVVEFRRHDDLESEFLKGLWYKLDAAGVALPVPHQTTRLVGDTPAAGFPGLWPQRRAPEAAPPLDPKGAEPSPQAAPEKPSI